jgi:hypothetical protein
LCGALSAQEFPRFSFDLGAGFTQPVGNTERNLDRGWNVSAGAGLDFTSYLGAMVHADYTSLGINSGTLNNLGFPGGNVNIFSASLDPIVHLTGHRPVDIYITGGGGLYHVTQEFTQPSTATFTAFDPFFGFYQFSTPSTEILSSYTVNKPGVDIGAGIGLGGWHGGKFFAEARYHRIFMGNDRHTDYVPVTFGFRW